MRRAVSAGHRRLSMLAPLALLAVAGCHGKKSASPPAPPAVNFVSRVGDEIITVEAFRAEAARRGVTPGNATAQNALLDEMIRNLKLLQYARQKGYDHNPKIVRRYHDLMIERAREDFDGGIGDAGQPIPEAEIRAYYDAHRAEFAVPARLRAAMIFVAVPPGLNPETLAAKQRKIEDARAMAVAAALAPEADFGALASTYSESQDSRYTGGDLGYRVEGMTNFSDDPTVCAALFALDTAGKISTIIRGKEGFYLFKLMERDPAGEQPLARVQARICSELRAAQQKEGRRAMDTALNAIPVMMHPEGLAAIPQSRDGTVNKDPAVPPRAPVGSVP